MDNMTSTHGLAWLVLSPIAMLGTLIASVVVLSFLSVFRSIDIFVTSILLTLFLDAGTLVIIQGVRYFLDLKWTLPLCQFYVWASIAFRLTELFTTVVFSIDRVLLLRIPGKYSYRGTRSVAAIAAVLWIFGIFIGAVPVIGWSSIHHIETNATHCLYFAHEVNHSFGIFVIVMEFAAFVICFGCLTDVFLHLRYFTKHTMFTPKAAGPGAAQSDPFTLQRGAQKQNGGPFQLEYDPEKEVTSVSQHTSTAQGSLEFAAAYDNCRFTCIASAFIYAVNHIPYMVSPCRLIDSVVKSLWLIEIRLTVSRKLRNNKLM